MSPLPYVCSPTPPAHGPAPAHTRPKAWIEFDCCHIVPSCTKPPAYLEKPSISNLYSSHAQLSKRSPRERTKKKMMKKTEQSKRHKRRQKNSTSTTSKTSTCRPPSPTWTTEAAIMPATRGGRGCRYPRYRRPRGSYRPPPKGPRSPHPCRSGFAGAGAGAVIRRRPLGGRGGGDRR